MRTHKDPIFDKEMELGRKFNITKEGRVCAFEVGMIEDDLVIRVKSGHEMIRENDIKIEIMNHLHIYADEFSSNSRVANYKGILNIFDENGDVSRIL